MSFSWLFTERRRVCGACKCVCRLCVCRFRWISGVYLIITHYVFRWMGTLGHHSHSISIPSPCLLTAMHDTHINTLKAYKLSYNEDFICSADSFVRVQENHCLSLLTFNAKIELLNKSIKGKWCYFASFVCNQWEWMEPMAIFLALLSPYLIAFYFASEHFLTKIYRRISIMKWNEEKKINQIWCSLRYTFAWDRCNDSTLSRCSFNKCYGSWNLNWSSSFGQEFTGHF